MKEQNKKSRHRKYFQQIIEGNFPNYQSTRRWQDMGKENGKEKKIPLPHHHQNTKHKEQRKNIQNCKGKRPSST